MKPTVFYFSAVYDKRNGKPFCENDRYEVQPVLAFVINAELPEMNGEEDDIIDAKRVELEDKYGVHDWGSSPCDEVEAIGYGTYEMGKAEFESCVNEWRDFFVGLVGADRVTKIVDITKAATETQPWANDYTCYKAVMEAV